MFSGQRIMLMCGTVCSRHGYVWCVSVCVHTVSVHEHGMFECVWYVFTFMCVLEAPSEVAAYHSLAFSSKLSNMEDILPKQGLPAFIWRISLGLGV